MIERAVDAFLRAAGSRLPPCRSSRRRGSRRPASEKAVSLARSASVQTSRPSAREGLAREALGQGDDGFLDVGVGEPVGLVRPSSLTSREKSRPVGAVAALVVGWAEIVGLKPSLRAAEGAERVRRHRVVEGLERLSSPPGAGPGCCQESARKGALQRSFAAARQGQEGASLMLTGQLGPCGEIRQLPRRSSWAGLGGIAPDGPSRESEVDESGGSGRPWRSRYRGARG